MKVQVIAALILLSFSKPLLATDWSHTYTSSQTFTITIGNAFDYEITITHWIGGASQTYPAITGKGTTKSIAVGPGKTDIHVKYSDGGTFKDPALLYCPGPSLRFAFTSHGNNCPAYTDATILIQPGT